MNSDATSASLWQQAHDAKRSARSQERERTELVAARESFGGVFGSSASKRDVLAPQDVVNQCFRCETDSWRLAWRDDRLVIDDVPKRFHDKENMSDIFG